VNFAASVGGWVYAPAPGQETSNVDVAIRVHVGPHDCWAIEIRLSHD
jgi:hypothetical protein